VETVVSWTQIVGAVLALVAVILAAGQLARAESFQRQARRDLREDNQTDFYLGLVTEIADLVAVLNQENLFTSSKTITSSGEARSTSHAALNRSSRVRAHSRRSGVQSSATRSTSSSIGGRE
jgi:hypothetical protein